MNPWFIAARPKTLPASISPILLGSALAYHLETFSLALFMLTLLCAISLQIAVNLANDYFDAKSGVDCSERAGPTRVMQQNLVTPNSMMSAIAICCAIAILSGVSLVWHSDIHLIWFGLLAMIAIFAYSGGPWPLASNGLGELTVFFFFGWLAVAGSYFVQAGEVSPHTIVYGSIAGFLSAAIMLVNNIRDIKTDALAGKSTLAVKLGDKKARQLYVVLLILALWTHYSSTSMSLSLESTYIPILVCMLPALFLCKSIFTRKLSELNQQLAQTALLLLLYCVTTSSVILFF